MGAIITKVYPIQQPVGESRQNMITDLESRLDQWYITLPEHLRYEASSNRRVTPPPQVLFLHIRYWGAVLLLHRGSIPNWKRCVCVDCPPARLTLILVVVWTMLRASPLQVIEPLIWRGGLLHT
jgi:hypothetical protein